MYLKQILIFLLHFVLSVIEITDAWRGNVCTRKATYYKSYIYCSKKTWWWCSRYSYSRRTYYYLQNFCCPGYTENGNLDCSIPVCSPRCQNGGECIRPDVCKCKAGYAGDICGGLAACSHLVPCYPGRCSLNAIGKIACMCSDGFGGPTCLTLTDANQKPEISKVNVTFAYFSFTKNEYAYDFKADGTGTTETDYLWINQNQFNDIKFDIDAEISSSYDFPNFKQNYIKEAKFGLTDARVQVQHTKLGQGGESVVSSKTYTCTEASDTRPVMDLKCRMNGTNIHSIDSGDKYRLTFTVRTGGYRDLLNTDTNVVYRRETYYALTSKNVIEFRFDYDVPIHCIENKTCTDNDVPLKLEKDITKEPVRSFWKGWEDRNLSGIAKYALEFWKMEYSIDYNGLREPDILLDYNPKPQYITEINATTNIDFPVYQPTESGVYSVILEVADQANNTRYARRIVIYDNTSEISLKQNSPLYATSASAQTDFTWQTTPNSDNSKTTTISVSWTGHFVNDLHESQHFLAKVLEYTPRLSDNFRRYDYKRIDVLFDDTEGERNKNPIHNINSIVRFETVHGTESTVAPTTGWTVVSPLKENMIFELTGVNIRDGDSRQIWVRAYDVMNNTKTDSTVVHFDHSPPNIYQPKFLPNVENATYDFSSRVIVTAKDDHSGIRKVAFKLTVNRTEEVTKEVDFQISTEPQDKCDNMPGKCYCIRKGDCFLIAMAIDVDNCWLKVPIDSKEDEIHALEVTVYNSAMLSSTTTYIIGLVNNLNGIQDYYSPSSITVMKTTDTSLRISWIQAPTCYERAGIIIKLFMPDNTTKEFKVHKDATQFDITGLTATTSYWFQLYTNYGNNSHFVKSESPAVLRFTTAEASRGFPPGGVAGLSAGFIFIIAIVVVVLLFLGRTGRLQPAKERVTQGFRTIRNTIRVRNPMSRRGGYNNRAYTTEFDDDIYYYGQMEIKNENWVSISRTDVSFESQLTEGRFATIYIVKYYGNHKEEKTVIAKVLKDDQNEDNIMKMKAKINFYTEKVGHHKNVMDFIGSVQDEVRGPFMLLEYCEKGVLKDFLVASNESFNMDLEERLFRIAFGICLGMDYLASKQVVHRRLAARNILLDHMFEPKIAGFGPDPTMEDGEGEERIPVKWMAPECMKSTKQANELSDVFSFGVVMWEIFSLGDTPYPGIQGREVPTRLKQGYKMKKPEYCDETFYKLMLKCWHYDPAKRQGFAQIKEQLTGMFQEGPGDEYYYRSNEI